MKFNFKKVTAIATSVLMTGMTIGTAVAAGVAPSDLGGSNFAIVYGANANSQDITAATNIDTALKSQIDSSTSVVAGSDALSDDEIVLGGNITSGKILDVVKHNKLDGLAKDKFSWNDGDGKDDYDFYEEILIYGTTKIATSLTDSDDNYLEAALVTDDGFEYRYVFDDADFDYTKVGNESIKAKDLTIKLLGQEYDITKITTNEITLATYSKITMGIDQSYTLANGHEVVLSSVFSDSVEVLIDGTSYVIDKTDDDGTDDVNVEVVSIGYNSNSPETSKAVLKISDEKSEKSYKDGKAFIGEPEKDADWVWSISFGGAEEYIGVKYNQDVTSLKDNPVKVGEGYEFPNNFAAITFDGLTETEYQELNVYFDEVKIYENDSADNSRSKVDALVIEGQEENTLKISGTTYESSKVYISLNDSLLDISYYDEDEGINILGKNITAPTATLTKVAEVTIEDTDLDILVNSSSLVISNEKGSNISLSIDLTDLTQLGGKAEEAESGDVTLNGNDIATKDTEYMDTYGIKISEGTTVESQVDKDELTLSVPEEQVYAQVSVSTGASASGSSAGNILYTDDEAGYSGKALVIVGGSCINSAAAEALEVAAGTCGADFTAATGVGAGQFLIKKTTLGGKTAIVVAGYDAGDTFQAAQVLKNEGVKEGIYTTATSEVVTTA